MPGGRTDGARGIDVSRRSPACRKGSRQAGGIGVIGVDVVIIGGWLGGLGRHERQVVNANDPAKCRHVISRKSPQRDLGAIISTYKVIFDVFELATSVVVVASLH